MNPADGPNERWHFGDRVYRVVLASAPDSMDLELDDLGPGPGRGTVMIASCADDTDDITVRVFTDEPMPLALIEQFVGLARLRLPASA